MKATRIPVPPRLKAEISSLEAQLAFCDALITFVGQIPDTIHQRAQIRIYKTLEEILQAELKKVKEEARERGKKLRA